MTAVVKQDSNRTGLRIAKELSPGVLPGSPVWIGVEPNSYKDFGAKYKMVSRSPINANRQKRKGVITDMDANAGYQADLTYANIQDFAEGVFCAAFRKKDELAVATVDSGTTAYQPAAGGAAYVAGTLLFAKGFTQTPNNGLKVVSGSGTGTSVPCSAGGLVTEAGASGTIVRVGRQAASGDVTVDASGTYPKLLSTVLDFTTLGLIVGEWIFIGGDVAGTAFATAANNGFARIYSVAAHAIQLDKTELPMVTDAGTGKTIRLFLGRVLKNELGTSIVQPTYQIERSLSNDDDSTPNSIQGEYVTGCILDQLGLTVNTADKITFDLSIMGSDYQTVTSTVGLKTGTRPAITGGKAWNTTSHVRRAQLSIVNHPEALFAYASDYSITIKNNVKANKAIGTLGAFSHTSGDFEVSATTNAYFANVAAAAAVRNNEDVTFDLILAQTNEAMVLDIPLVGLGDGSLKVTADAPIMIPLTADAGTCSDVNPNADYTMLLTFFDYVPNLAM